ncbi:diacylglycerol kinase family protein [Lactobacillus delbrueckii]|uniref:hypothetical protein n=1 Tax=Lactobacillus delbrueckii TaxID=1584 RepID=UPI001E42419D|nr:hypothetical protein [Lactobacillus delbrueckii]
MLDVKTLKSAAYVASILRNISRYKFAKVKVIGHKMACFFNDQVTLCAFCNGRFYGGGFQISPKSKINDSITTPAAMNLDGEKKEAAKYHLVVQPKSLNLVI